MLSPQAKKSLQNIAQSLVAPGKGILAIDESHGTCKKRFDMLNIDCTQTTRQQYRQLLITAPDIESHVSGMILFDETLRQSTDDGTPFPQALLQRGIQPGIKVDLGTEDIPHTDDEKRTKGIDGLRERLAEYKNLGATFTKFRCVINISSNKPSAKAVLINANTLALYADYVQEAGMVPIVEPEVIMDGDHSIEDCKRATSQILEAVFTSLAEHNVYLPGIILKPNMILSGTNNADQSNTETIAQMTRDVLTQHVPADVAGVAFLSGGQTGPQACIRMSAMNAEPLPWPLTFSFGRAIQQPALDQWAGNNVAANVLVAQEKLLHRLQMSANASQGQYDISQDNDA